MHVQKCCGCTNAYFQFTTCVQLPPRDFSCFNTMPPPSASIEEAKAQSVDKKKLRYHKPFRRFKDLAAVLELHSDFAWSAEEARQWISQPEQDDLKDVKSTRQLFIMALQPKDVRRNARQQTKNRSPSDRRSDCVWEASKKQW